MIEKKTIIDQIEIARDGTINIRYALLLIEDGKDLSCQWHRTSIPPGVDVDRQLAEVDNHLTSGVGPSPDQLTKFPAADMTRVPLVKEIAKLVHSPAVVSAHRARIAQK
jgi:hypothetical protein